MNAERQQAWRGLWRRLTAPPHLKLGYQIGIVLFAAALVLTAIYAPSIVELAYYYRLTAEVKALPAAPPFTAADRLLVIAPHPDDEVLACAGSIQHALAAGAQVHIVWLTCGDGFEWDEILMSRVPRPPAGQMLKLGRRRAEEARESAAVLGVPFKNLHFLGYPDGGLLRLFLNSYATPYTSRYTRVDTVPYGFAQSPGAPYTGQSLERDLRTVVTAYKPTVVLAPAVQDRHPDHRATAYMTLRLFGELGQLDNVRWYIVHGGIEWPVPKGFHLRLPLGVAPRGAQLHWQRVDLAPELEQRKREAVAQYNTQVRALGGFLHAFVRTNELVASDVSLEPIAPEAQEQAERESPP